MPDIDPAIMAEMEARLAEDRPCTSDGYSNDGGYRRPIWTSLGFLRRGDRYVLVCKACGTSRDAPLAEVVAANKGNRPMHTLKWKACECGSSAFKFEPVRNSP